ncbi:DgyrCDS14532 [Dimorphilus gyrociliatus]|uniref:DgyrCDS14532 n=1 Tax=Dimorphilus gyrociliatus TaxID=2664684 RepID=A0A7I8WE37_9ANNE|nr:DgyrCDS14532 [Dimorphilus gyrociliatus]
MEKIFHIDSYEKTKEYIEQFSQTMKNLNLSYSIQTDLCNGIQSSGKYNIALNKAIEHNGVVHSNQNLGGCTQIITHVDSTQIWITIDLVKIYTTRQLVIYPSDIPGYDRKIEISATNSSHPLSSPNLCLEDDDNDQDNNFLILTSEFISLIGSSGYQSKIALKSINIIGMFISEPDLVNIARGKPCWLSSTHSNQNDNEWPFYATFATDGFNAYYMAGSGLNLPMKWMFIDLLDTFTIDYICIHRTFHSSHKYQQLQFKFMLNHMNFNPYEKLATSDCSNVNGDGERGGTVRWLCTNSLNYSRFLFIQDSVTSQLEIFEILAYGKRYLFKNIEEIPLIEAISNELSVWDPTNSPLKVIDGNFYNIESVPKYSSCSKISSTGDIILTFKFDQIYLVDHVIFQPFFDVEIDPMNISVFTVITNGYYFKYLCSNFTTAKTTFASLIEVKCTQQFLGNELLVIKSMDPTSTTNELKLCEVKVFGKKQGNKHKNRHTQKCL